MSKETNYFKIGFFTLSAFLALAAGVIFFGLSSAFRPTLNCATFFDHSVQGLSVGAPVNFRGFKVGQVSAIGLPGLSGYSGQKVVEVDFFLFPALLSGDEATTVLEARKYLEKEIDAGMRVYLTFQGVSGVSFLDLDYRSDTDSAETPHPRYKTTLLMIPNAPGTVLEISESVSRIVRSFRAVDFDRLGQKLDLTLTNFSLLAATLNQKTAQVSDEMRITLKGLQATADNIGKFSDNLTYELKDLELQQRLTELGETIRRAKSVLARTDQFLKNSQDNLSPAMESFKIMTENLREFSETAKRYPSQIIFGQPPTEAKPR
ncbi:MAG: MlaD family protein [Deltaproteobacteria bacterium]|jgi:ABC-type transporter Mla subunit MlaD|nr:MlaD family protein [Deltaproteobacteria bacterium]